MTSEYQSGREQLLTKLERWKEFQVAYPGRFDKQINVTKIKSLDDGITAVKTAGRLMTIRAMGKICFAHLQDESGRAQISFTVDSVGKDRFKFLTKNLDAGDHIGVSGEIFTTQKGEKTLKATEVVLLSKALRFLPEKWHGLQDPEVKARQRYLDLISNEDTRKRFELRADIILFIREFLNKNSFIEVETPILQTISSGASARPFITHHNAMGQDLYLRIAPETYLKRLIASGYDKVFELGKCFRNEGMDSSHLQEFTMLEFYAAYWDYRDNIEFFKKFFKGLLNEVLSTEKIIYQGQEIDFSGDWKEITFTDLVKEHAGIDLLAHETLDDLKDAINEKGLKLDLDQYVGKGALMDALYKKYCRPKLIRPTILVNHPEELVPLARRCDEDYRVLDMFQFVVNSWEIVKAYSELVDPCEQKARLLEQAKLAEAGDDETVMMEEDFITAMEYGMPPISGLGLGIDRLIALLTDSPSIRDVVYFPNTKNVTE